LKFDEETIERLNTIEKRALKNFANIIEVRVRRKRLSKTWLFGERSHESGFEREGN